MASDHLADFFNYLSIEKGLANNTISAYRLEYYVGTQAHPEFLSRPTNPHPLFVGLIAAAIAKHGK